MSITSRARTALGAILVLGITSSLIPLGAPPAAAAEPAQPECTTFFLNQTEDYNWANPANWSTLTVPGVTDVACIDDDDVVSGSDARVGTLRGTGALTVADGSFEVAGSIALGSVEIQGGELIAGGPAAVAGFAQSAGVLGGAGTLTVASSFEWSGGSQAGPGATHLLPGATAVIHTDGAALSWGARELAADASVRIAGDGIVDFGSARARLAAVAVSGAQVDVLGTDTHVFGGALDDATVSLPVGNQLTQPWSLVTASSLTLDGSIITGSVTLDASSELRIDGDVDAQDPTETTLDTIGSIGGSGLITVTTAGALLAAGPVRATSLRNSGVIATTATGTFTDIVSAGELLLELEADVTASSILVDAQGRIRVAESATLRVPEDGVGLSMDSGRLEIAGVILGDVEQAGGEIDVEGDASIRGAFAQSAGTLRVHGDPAGTFATLGVDGPVSVAGTLWLVADGVVQQEAPVIIGQTVAGQFADLVAGESCADAQYETDRVIVRSTACPQVGSIAVSEGDGLATLGVSIAEPLAAPYAVTYETVDGSAVAGDDYVAATGAVTIAPGDTTAAIEIALVDDDTAESDESFGVNIVGANTAAVGLVAVDVVDDDERAGDHFFEFSPIIFGGASAMGISSTTAVGIVPGPDAETYGWAWTYSIADGQLARLDWAGGAIVQDVNEAGSVLAGARVREPDGTIRVLQIPPGSEWFEPRALADDGTVSGWAVYPTDPSTLDYRLVRWAPDGTPTVLTAGVEGLAVHGNDINNHGVIAGTVIEIVDRQPTSVRAFRYDDTNGLVLLPSLDGDTGATAINDRGEIVGRSGDHAVRWTPDGEIVDLGIGTASDVNNAGLVVGSAPSDEPFVNQEAVAWNEAGRHYLDDAAFGLDPDWVLSSATSVNDRGDIVGEGYSDFAGMTYALRVYDCVICVRSEFVEAQVADPTQWSTVLTSTTEGNPVRLRAELTNQINDVAEIDVTVLDALTGEPVDEAITLALAANGGRQTIEVDIDTDGMAWSNGTKADPRRFEVEIRRAGSNVMYERAVAVLTVNPRPLVLVHGLWSDASTWDLYPSLVRNAHPDWLVVPVETMDTGWRTPKTIDQNAFEVEAAIEPIRVITNAWQVDIVGHSMGGLISRSYIQNLMPSPVSPFTGEAVPAVRRLVMLGTPNFGSPCADLAPSPATYELQPDVVGAFNARTTRRFGVEFSVAVGQHLPFTCLSPFPGDDVVPEVSAAWGIADAVEIPDMPHTSMTSSPTLFNDFVMPRLTGTVIVGAAADRAALAEPAAADATTEAAQAAPEFPPVQGLYFANSVLDPGSVDAVGVNVPSSASHVGVVIAARDVVSAELVDPRGVVQATLAAATQASDHPAFRTLVAPASAGRWILRVHNTGTEVEEVSIGAAAPGSPIELSLAAQQSHWSGRVRVTATLDAEGIDRPTRLEAAVRTSNGDTSIDLFDDGLHRDGVAGDGIYAGVAESVPEGIVTATVQMILPGFMRAATASATVTIPDTPPVNSMPVATPATVSAERGVALTLPLTGIDLDDDELTVTIVDGPAHGTLVEQANRWIYTSAADYTGTDVVTFTVSDGSQVSAPAAVTIVVDHSPVLLGNDGPTTAAQHQTVRLAAKVRDPYTGAWVPGTTVRFELGGTTWTAVSAQSTTVVDPEPQLDLAPGSYVLTITAEASDRFAAATIQVPFTVTANRAPAVHFEQRQGGDEAGYPIWFGATVNDPDDTDDVIGAEWDFDGDGTVDQRTGAVATYAGAIWTTHTYPDTATGQVAPAVTVVDRAGNRTSATMVPFDLLPHAPLGSPWMVRADERSMTALGIDDSGRFVLGAAYTPGSSNPVRRRLEVVDRTTGTSEVVSVDPSGQALDAEIGVISPDGRYVAFAGRSAGDTHAQVYLRDRTAGTTELVSGRGTTAGSGHSRPVAVSNDAARVLFSTAATDLAGGCGAGCDSLVVWARATGAFELVSVIDGVAVDGEQGDLSADGTRVAVRLRPPGNWYEQVYVRDLATGTTTLASATPAGQPGNGPSGSPRLDGDGSTVLFVSAADDLVAGDTNNRGDVVVRELPASTSRLVAPLAGSSGAADLSTDGSTVATALTRDPATGEPLTASQVYAITLHTGEARLLSRSIRTGAAGIADSVLPPAPGLLSANGACVVFASLADNLVPGDVYDIDGTVTNDLGRWYDTFVDEGAACTAPTNQVPVAHDIDAITEEDTAVDLTLEAVDADGDGLTFVIVDGPTNGTLDGTGPTYRYTPAPDWHGTDTVTFTASDGIATSQIATATITVRPVDEPAPQCTFGGFGQPVDSAPTVNTVKAGSNVPLKFTYCADGRLAIFAAGSPASAAHVCGAGPTDALEETGQPGASTLTFDPLTGRYHYNWKTEKSWKGQCRTLVFTFLDGTSVTAEFKFT